MKNYEIGNRYRLAKIDGYFPVSVKIGEGFEIAYMNGNDITLKSDNIHIDELDSAQLKTQYWEYTADQLTQQLRDGILAEA